MYLDGSSTDFVQTETVSNKIVNEVFNCFRFVFEPLFPVFRTFCDHFHIFDFDGSNVKHSPLVVSYFRISPFFSVCDECAVVCIVIDLVVSYCNKIRISIFNCMISSVKFNFLFVHSLSFFKSIVRFCLVLNHRILTKEWVE
ncbi:hypothetical protein B2G88_12170 [Natronolimnobius baerhuensis]|uniref:Uncharacterized protein n=1 Tax=Natronolimnobius baerhuensis TaxID=253108 RepID=A0A202EA11_9EURY|nr:hypothetical protein B2G88_12170 [Natronolimnobius baerhuensis]